MIDIPHDTSHAVRGVGAPTSPIDVPLCPQQVLPLCQQWQELLQQHGLTVPVTPHWQNALQQVFCGTEFVTHILRREPKLFIDLYQTGILLRDYTAGEMAAKLQEALIQVSTETELHIALRHFRRLQMVRIIWRDLAGWASLDSTLQDLSALADACVIQALEMLHNWQVRTLGNPEDKDGKSQHLIVLAMGKLGACELNMSSDIDLILVFPEYGQLRLSSGKLSHMDSAEFFTRLAQKLLQALQQPTAEGLVFRVDVRLRPFGEAGPLVLSISAMEDYYQTQARDWERYAMVKARPLTGDPQAINQLMSILQPFVYRRYLDFVAIESLRELKRLIMHEVTRQGLEDNIKLGPGGIREIEFIGQVFQIIRGGREPELRLRPILSVLALLATKGLLPEQVVAELIAAYRFLRLVENRLQAWRDLQTHSLPTDVKVRIRLAYSMGYADWTSFYNALDSHRQLVQQHFDTVFSNSREETPTKPYQELGRGVTPHLNLAPAAWVNKLWHGLLEPDKAQTLIANLGFTAPQKALQRLLLLRDSPTSRTLGARGQNLLVQLLPKLLQTVATYPQPDRLLEQLLRLLETIAKRSTYLALLLESPVALEQLVRLTDSSAWILEQLLRFPHLLDELLDPRRLYAPQRHQELQMELHSQLVAIPASDQEQQMECLRQFANSNKLRVAAADLTGVLPIMVVSDYLTDLAEVILAAVLDQCWLHLTARHGYPSGATTTFVNGGCVPTSQILETRGTPPPPPIIAPAKDWRYGGPPPHPSWFCYNRLR